MNTNHTSQSSIDLANDSIAQHIDRKRATNGKPFVHPLSKVTSQLTDRVIDEKLSLAELAINDTDDAYEIPCEHVYNDDDYADIQNGNELDPIIYNTSQWSKLATVKKEHIYEQIVLKDGAVECIDGDDYDDADLGGVDVGVDRQSNGNAGNDFVADALVPDVKQQQPKQQHQKSFVHTLSPKCANGEKPPESPTLSLKSSSDGDTKSTKSQLFAICAQVNGLSTMNETADEDTAMSVALDTVANDIYETIDAVSQDVNDDTISLQQSHNLTVSSASIYSTNSASSSASEQSTNKQAGDSYMTSNESLTEQNGVEPLKLTPAECTCLEIVETERAYNNDLSRIIQGYVGRQPTSDGLSMSLMYSCTHIILAMSYCNCVYLFSFAGI